MVGDFKEKILSYLKEQESIPNFLFYSTIPGTGKSSLSKCIINELGCDALIINSSDERKIDVIRDKVKEFALTKSSNGKRRCVMLDEADGILQPAQNALRNIMEVYSSNVFFILTCNNLNKVIEPIQSRCVVLSFAYPNKEEVKLYLKMICSNEDMNFTDEGLDTILDYNYPSIRNCVICLQDLKTEGKDIIKDNIKPVNEIFEDVWELLQKKNFKDIKKIVMESTLDPRELNTFFWNKAIENEEANLKLIQLTCRNEKDIANGSDPKIIFITSVIEMMK